MSGKTGLSECPPSLTTLRHRDPDYDPLESVFTFAWKTLTTVSRNVQSDGRFVLEVRLPANTTARIHFPARRNGRIEKEGRTSRVVLTCECCVGVSTRRRASDRSVDLGMGVDRPCRGNSPLKWDREVIVSKWPLRKHAAGAPRLLARGPVPRV